MKTALTAACASFALAVGVTVYYRTRASRVLAPTQI